MADRQPSKGDMVRHLGRGEDDTDAAVVTAVGEDGLVSLTVMGEGFCLYKTDVPFSAMPRPGHWSWPPDR